MAAGPTQRTLEALRKDGWRCQVVERWNPHSRTRHDLFGVIDVLAIRGGEVLAVQATSGSNVSSRVAKISESEAISDIRQCGWMMEVWGWRKNAKGRWQCRKVDLS